MTRLSSRFRNLPKLDVAVLLVLVGVGGRLLLVRVANVETVLAVSMLAGALLGWRYALAVSLAVMALSDLAIYGMGIGGEFGLWPLVGLTAFTWSGFLFVGALGAGAGRRRIVFTTRSIALLTTVSIPATILYDVWTAFGDWVFLAAPRGVSLETVFFLQVPFTLIHLASSLVFVPLFGTIFTYLAGTDVTAPSVDGAPGRESRG